MRPGIKRRTTVACAVIAAVMASLAYGDELDDAMKHFSFAVQNKNSENFEEAERQYEKSLTYCDTLYQVHYSYADMLYQHDRPDDAKREFLRALELDPSHYNTAAMLARIYYESAMYDSSLVMYELMDQIQPDTRTVLVSIAGLREFLGHDEGALDVYEQLIRNGEDSYDNHIKAAQLSLKQDDQESARSHAILALAKKSGDIEALTIAAETSMTLGEQKQAAGYYRELAACNDQTIAVDAFFKLEQIYRTLSDNENLVWTLERHHEAIPEDIDVLGELCEVLYSFDQLDRGIMYVREGLALDSTDGRFRILLGENFRELGQDEQALEQYRIAMDDPEWKSSAQRLIWQIEKPESEEENMERDFFKRGK